MMKLILFLIIALIITSPTMAQNARVNLEQTNEIKKQLNDQQTVERTIKKRFQKPDDHNYLSFSYENDLIGGGTDENYTSGLRLTYFDTETSVPPGIDALADLIPTFDLNETTSTFFTFGQNIYTPQNINIRALQQNDRPYAAWLYGSVGLATVTKKPY